MATPLDMSLDDVIKRNGRERGRGRRMPRRGQGTRGFFSGGMAGPGRRGPPSVGARPFPIAKPPRRNKVFSLQRDLFEDSLKAAGISGIEIGTKLFVSNLDYGVTNDDIRELFSEIGDMRRFALHYDKNGRPSGSAEVMYTRRSDAFAAQRRYDNVLLDGKPMKVEVVGANAGFPVSTSLNVNVDGINGRGKRRTFVTPRPANLGGSTVFKRSFGYSQNRGGGGIRGGRGGGRGRGRGRGRGWVKKKAVEKSADELNKELETYHEEAMQT